MKVDREFYPYSPTHSRWGRDHAVSRFLVWNASHSGSCPRGREPHLGNGKHLGFSRAPLLASQLVNRAGPDSPVSARVMEFRVLRNGEMSSCLLPSLQVYGRPPKCWWTLRRHGRFLAICSFASLQVSLAQ